MEFLIIALSAMCFQLLVVLGLKKYENRELKTENIILKSDIQDLKSRIAIQKAIYESELEKNYESLEIPDGTVEAVRYAMIHNHPDNGGSAERFILYKNCYDKLTGGKRNYGS